MEKYSVLIKASAVKELEGIPRNDLRSISRKIAALSDDPRPRGCEKLSGQERYRVRQGNYRIIYSVEDEEKIILVVKIAHRQDVYR